MSKRKLIDVYIYGLLLVLLLVVVHAPLTVWLGTVLPDLNLYVKAWKEAVLVLLSVVALVLITRHRLWNQLLEDWLVQLSLGFIVLHVLLLPLNWQGAQVAAAGLAIDLRHILMLLLCYLAIKLAPKSMVKFRKVAIAGALIVVGFASLQLIMPVDTLKHIGYGDSTIQPYLTIDQNPDYVRHSSTLRGPNPLGAYAAGVVLIALAVLSGHRFRQPKLAWLLAAGGLVAVISSFSRSAALALAFGGLFILLFRYARRLNRLSIGLILVATILMAGAFMLVRDSHFISNVVLHEDPNEAGQVNSNDEHLTSLQNGTSRMLAQPLGAGIGSTGSASLLGDSGLIIENQYLYVAHESGWLGLGLFLAVYGLILWRLWQGRRDPWALGLLASGLGLAVAALFLPVWADDTVAVIWWGLAGLTVAKFQTCRFEQKTLY